MSDVRALLPAVLAGAAVSVWIGLPSAAALRVDGLLVPARASPARAGTRRRVRAAAVLAQWSGRARQRVGARGRAEREQARAVEACTVLSAELRAGRSAAIALEAAAAVASGGTAAGLRAAAAAASLGGDVATALVASTSSSAVPELLRGLAACWAVCAGTGSGLAAAVERLGEAQRAAAEQRRAVEVELAGPQATARLLALLPVVGLLLAAGLGAAPLDFLLGTTPGRVCLVLGLLLELLGLRWTARLAGRAAG